MADNIVLKNEETNDLGRIEMAPEVLEIIIGIAAAKVDGVYSMRGSLANNISALLGRQNRGKDLAVDVYTFLNYGVSVPKVANEIQEKVRQQVLFMTGIELAAVNVHIQGMVPEKEEPTVDPNNLFEENGDE